MVEDDRYYYQHLAEAEVERARATMLPNVVEVYYQFTKAYLDETIFDSFVKADAA